MPNDSSPPSFLRRIAVVIYDAMLLIAILFVATLLVTPFHSAGIFEPSSTLYSAYLMLVCFLFYGWFWTHGGQTLGLQTWKMRIVSDDGLPLSWQAALIRFAVGSLSWLFLGLGFIWILFNEKGLSWHDIASKSHVERYIKD